MASLVDQIEHEVERESLLNHPFYQMWSKGELSLTQLSGYAKEYFQLVKVVPEMVRAVSLKSVDSQTKQLLEQHIREEEEHIELWRRFASALNIEKAELEDYAGSTMTQEAVSSLVNLIKTSTFEEAASVMYSYEWEIPKISKSKLDGLLKFYRMTSKDATVYFETHMEADVRHAATWRSLITGSCDNCGDPLEAAARSIAAQNKLLDSVMESYGSLSQ